MAALLGAAVLATCAPPARPPGDGPALWRITDADSEIWLFGTVHVLPRALTWRTARMDAAFRAADTIVFETDVEGGRATIAALVAEHGALPAGQTLSGALDGEARARLARVAASLGTNATAFERVRPWLAALQLSLLAVTKRGSEADAGVESVLGAEAHTAGKTFAYLETPEAQIRALSDLSPAAERAFFDASLRQIEEESSEMDALDQAWVTGNLAQLAHLTHPMLAEAGPEAYAALITRRNHAWADEIAHMLEGEGRVFIAVGAAHLVGGENVVDLLRARGIAVEGP